MLFLFFCFFFQIEFPSISKICWLSLFVFLPYFCICFNYIISWILFDIFSLCLYSTFFYSVVCKILRFLYLFLFMNVPVYILYFCITILIVVNENHSHDFLIFIYFYYFVIFLGCMRYCQTKHGFSNVLYCTWDVCPFN